MSYTCQFDEDNATDTSIVGGKGANLGRLTQAGFRVPPGFVVTTDAYRETLRSTGIDLEVITLLDQADYDDPEGLEVVTRQIRDLVVAAGLPDAIRAAILAGYADLGEDTYVAVRSSGTAEDLPEASYAGMHDTYLDICGSETTLDAVRRCWASLWTARAVAYRHNQGIAHDEVQIAIVVQRMVESEVAGVMFTGNPLSTATDQLVINASWGLGEAVVSGMVTPDEFVVRHRDLTFANTETGTKALKIVRDLDNVSGTVTEEVSPADRERLSLTPRQVAELSRVGLRIQEYYGGLPQDVEWGLFEGEFYVLQARPITGVEFSWDCDVDGWQTNPDDDDDVWTRGMADEVWTGAITPLMYSWRGPSWDAGSVPAARLWGFQDLAKTRFWKYHKAEAYYNCRYEQILLERTAPPPLRPFMVSSINKLPADWREDLAKTPFSYWGYAKVYARVQALAPQLYEGFKVHENYINNRNMEAAGLTEEEVARMNDETVPFAERNLLTTTNDKLAAMSDSELVRFIQRGILWEDTYNVDQWTWFFMNARDVFALLAYLTFNWFDGDAMAAYMDMITGTPKRTITPEANLEMWKLTEQIRNTPTLKAAFETLQDGAFFAELEQTEDGRAFLTGYHSFLARHGHRGHADRDIYFPRRIEDPAIDYAAFRALLSVEHSAVR